MIPIRKSLVLALSATLAFDPLMVLAANVSLQPAVANPGAPYAVPAQYVNNPAADPKLTTAQLVSLLRKRVKYVFVVFHENHSFDNEYGTLPGARGLYGDENGPYALQPASNTQRYTDAGGSTFTVTPFLVGPAQSANVVDSVDHSHTGLATKIDATAGSAAMDKFSQDEYNNKNGTNTTVGAANDLKGKQFATLVMAHTDCNTTPFFWQWASNFTIFDGIFATEDTPSTPNAVAMISGQAGETQWVKHANAATGLPASDTANAATTSYQQKTISSGTPVLGTGLSAVNEAATTSSTTQAPPLVNDPQPYYGSPFDSTVSNGTLQRQPYGPYESFGPTNVATNLTFASLPLTFMGNGVTATMNGDLNPAFDNPDVQDDIAYIQSLGYQPVNWTWYQAGYGLEASDSVTPSNPSGTTQYVPIPAGTAAGATDLPSTTATHNAYVSHHQGPDYFGYVANNPSVYNNGHLKGETDFFTDIAGTIPAGGSGVFYIRGGYVNQQKDAGGNTLKAQYHNARLSAASTPYTLPQAQDLVAAAKSGDDDHPSYSDRQISEAMTANVINAIAGNPALWAQSAIIVTYDESDGFYDHVPPRILSYGPDKLPLSRGVRVPLLLVSPYARSHAVSHAEGDHNAVIQTINSIFGLPALASLPDEASALLAGNAPLFNQFGPAGFQQMYLGPHDQNSPISDSLLSGFDPRRLMGTSAPLPATLAQIGSSRVSSFPHDGNQGCSAIGIRPLVPAGQAADYAPPAVPSSTNGFNTLPSTLPNLN